MMGLQENLDGKLVKRVCGGDEGAFEVLYDKYKIHVHKLLASLVTHEEAEDLLQDTFIKAYKRIATLQEPEKFQNWLYRIARNSAYDVLRSRYKYIVQSLDEIQATDWLESGDDPLDYLAEEELMRQAFAYLPAKQRECLLLHINGLSSREIAAIVGLSEASVPIYQGKAKRWLKERYRYLQRQSDGDKKEKFNEED